MPAYALAYPGIWPAGTPTLGQLDLTYIKPIADASHYWSAQQLAEGALPAWTDRISGLVMSSPGASQQPTVYTGNRKVVRLDGINDRLDVAIDMRGARTVAVVGRLSKAETGQYMITNGESSGSFNLYTGGNGNFAFYAGKALSSTKPMDSGNHVFLIVSDGARSVLNIDGQEWFGDPGTSLPTAIRIGASGSAYFGADLQALAILPYAAGPERRASLVAQLKTQYKIGS